MQRQAEGVGHQGYSERGFAKSRPSDRMPGRRAEAGKGSLLHTIGVLLTLGLRGMRGTATLLYSRRVADSDGINKAAM